MKNEENDIGKQGEDMAAVWYLERGYRLRDRNWRTGHLECDLILEKEGELIFAEVKTRSGTGFGPPESFVTLKKQRDLLFLANRYVQQKELDLSCRFDIVSILFREGRQEIKIIESAFTAVSVNMSRRR
jgi:putative endonuclease